MIPVMCITQQGQIPPAAEHGLKAKIAAFTQRAFAANADIDWIEVPAGSGFSAAEPSTVLVVSLLANRPLERTARRALMHQLAGICQASTGKPAEDIVISVRNAQE